MKTLHLISLKKKKKKYEHGLNVTSCLTRKIQLVKMYEIGLINQLDDKYINLFIVYYYYYINLAQTFTLPAL